MSLVGTLLPEVPLPMRVVAEDDNVKSGFVPSGEVNIVVEPPF